MVTYKPDMLALLGKWLNTYSRSVTGAEDNDHYREVAA